MLAKILMVFSVSQYQIFTCHRKRGPTHVEFTGIILTTDLKNSTFHVTLILRKVY